MKIKTSKKDIKKRFETIITVPNESIYYLLIFKSPFAYSERSIGWACDYYCINNICICQGYAPITSGVVNADYASCKNFNDKAKKIYNNENINHEEKEKKILKLLELFVITVKGGNNE